MLSDREIRAFKRMDEEEKKEFLKDCTPEEAFQLGQAVISFGNAAATQSTQSIAEMEKLVDSLKSQLANAQKQIAELSKLPEPEEQIEGQLTLEDEIQYQSRHGQEGHENYTRIMDQLSEEDRKKVRETYYADSDGVFSLDDLAHQKGTTFEEIFYILHPEMKESNMIDFTTDTNEFGF